MDLKLLGHNRITGLLELVSGLHIGRGREEVELGGKDHPVVVTALDQTPFIPGSSLKGKLRALLEWDTGVHPQGRVRGTEGSYAPDDPVLRVFGVQAAEGAGGGGPELGPTRALVADCPLAAERDGATRDAQPYDWLRRFQEGAWRTEEKTESALNRITAVAHPRLLERVPAGVQFACAIRYRLFELNGDGGRADREHLRWLLWALALLEDDALGGGGSRGSGQVRFLNLKLTDEKGQTRPLDLGEVRKNRPRWTPGA